MKLARLAMPAIALFAIASQAQADLQFRLSISGLTNGPGAPIQSCSFGIQNQSAQNAQTYSGKKGSFSNLTLVRASDDISGAIGQACYQGTQFTTVEVKGVDSQTQDVVFDLVMTRCFISSLQMGGVSNGGSTMYENVTISGTKITLNGVVINPNTLAGMQKANAMIAKLIKKYDAAKSAIK